MATGKVNRSLISTRHLIIEYSKKGLSAVHIQRQLHRKHNVATTRQSIFKFVKQNSSTGVLAPPTRRDNNRFPRKLTTFQRRCIDMWLRHNSELTFKPFFEYSIIKCRVDINDLLTLPVAIFVYKQCLFISVT
jgi:hypothetical protein